MPARGSGGLVSSCSLLINGILAALRQKFHLSTCPNFAGHLYPRDQSVPPHHADGAQSVAYGDWLLKFCVSVSWRVILEFREKDSLSDYTDEQLIRIDAASRAWADFLLGRIPHPGMFEQHFLLMDAIE